MIDLEALGIKFPDEEEEKIHFTNVESKRPCGYFDNRESNEMIAVMDEESSSYRDTDIYDTLLRKGYRRCADEFYFNKCKDCNECTPIRIPTRKFKPTKSQLKVWDKNEDLEVRIVQSMHGDYSVFCTDEKAELYREYDYYHNKNNPGYEKLSLEDASNILFMMHYGYTGVMDMEYRLNGKLIAVGLLDYTQDDFGAYSALSSNYFYYSVEDEVRKRSVGVYSVLMEILWCRRFNVQYYYLGLYLPNCRKMNYKINYKPYQLYENGVWNEYSVDDEDKSKSEESQKKSE